MFPMLRALKHLPRFGVSVDRSYYPYSSAKVSSVNSALQSSPKFATYRTLRRLLAYRTGAMLTLRVSSPRARVTPQRAPPLPGRQA